MILGYNPNKYLNEGVCFIDLKIIPTFSLVPGHDPFSTLRYYNVMYNNIIFRIIYIHIIILLKCLWKWNIYYYRVVQINTDWIIYSCTKATSEVQHFIFRRAFITVLYVIITVYNPYYLMNLMNRMNSNRYFIRFFVIIRCYCGLRKEKKSMIFFMWYIYKFQAIVYNILLQI